MLSLQSTNGRAGEADAICCGVCARINGCHGNLCKTAGEQAEQDGKCFHDDEVRKGGGDAPRSVSGDQSSDQAVTLADRGGNHEPQIPLAIV